MKDVDKQYNSPDACKDLINKQLGVYPTNVREGISGGIIIFCQDQKDHDLVEANASRLLEYSTISSYSNITRKPTLIVNKLSYLEAFDMIEDLNALGIEDIIKMHPKKDIPLVKIVCENDEIPRELLLGNLIVGDQLYFTEPNIKRIPQCDVCLKFGHVNTYKNPCKEDQRCTDCGNYAHQGKCQLAKVCVNCKHGHGAYYRKCEAYQELKKEAMRSELRRVKAGIKGQQKNWKTEITGNNNTTDYNHQAQNQTNKENNDSELANQIRMMSTNMVKQESINNLFTEIQGINQKIEQISAKIETETNQKIIKAVENERMRSAEYQDKTIAFLVEYINKPLTDVTKLKTKHGLGKAFHTRTIEKSKKKRERELGESPPDYNEKKNQKLSASITSIDMIVNSNDVPPT